MMEMLRTILRLKLRSLKAQLEYPANFLMQIATVALVGLLSIPSLLLLTSAFPSIGGWGFSMLAFMAGLRHMAAGVHHALFFSLLDHRDLVRNGEFDRLLVRPIHPLLQIMASGLDLAAIGEFLPGLALFALTYRSAAIEWNLAHMAFLVVVVLSGAIIEGAVYLFFAAFDFWLEEAEALLYIPDAFLESVLQYPAHIYDRPLALFITVVFPYAFMAYFPTLYFFRAEVAMFPRLLACLTPAVAVVAAVVAVAFWSLGLKHYQSTGT
jgi:ABC-2 type transport system permease protein